MNRRQLLASSAALAAAAAVPSRGLASRISADRRFLFVFSHGGWDTTRVFAPEFGNPSVDMERSADPWSIGGLSLVDAPRRPSVRAFFEANHGRVAIVNGLLVPSVAHETCAEIVMTGGTRGTPDWAALIAAQRAEQYVLPNLVVDCPSFPSQLGMAVARSGSSGQLDGLVDGSLVEDTDRQVPLPDASVQGMVDRFLLRRAAAAVQTARSEPERAAFEAFREAAGRAIDLKDARLATTFGADGGFPGKIEVAVEALSTGLSRCVSLAHPDPFFAWDSHADNDGRQSVLWEDLFAGLLRIEALLATTPGPAGGLLADETVVVVVSEMGRTPKLNGDAGKDHWPYTSAMLFGAGVRGDQQLGGFDDGFRGRPVEIGSDGVVPTASHLGATLLTLGGHDPGPWVPGYAAIDALVA